MKVIKVGGKATAQIRRATKWSVISLFDIVVFTALAVSSVFSRALPTTAHGSTAGRSPLFYG